MKIAFPEYKNPIIREAVEAYNAGCRNGGSGDNGGEGDEVVPVEAENLTAACRMVKAGKADALIAGIDYTTREVVLACKNDLGMAEGTKTFSSCFVMKRNRASSDFSDSGAGFSSDAKLPETLVVADAGVTKNPTAEQLYDIVMQTYETARKILAGSDTPRIAMLSFSSFGSARDESIDKIRAVLEKVHAKNPEIRIDGEMQLDCAVNPRVAEKKIKGRTTQDFGVAGQANVLICPDLNSGNILYKALEQFGGYVAAGPILQGFSKPASDLSRGSTAEDVELVIKTVAKLA